VITLRRYPKDSERFEADIRFTWPSGRSLRRRLLSPFRSKTESERWARAREMALIAAGEGEAGPAPGPASTPPTAEAPHGSSAGAPSGTKSGVPAETCNAWHLRYLAHCTTKGLSTVGDKSGRWRKWIAPRIGEKAMATVTREDVEDVRDALDDLILEYARKGPGRSRISAKTAQNAWNELTVSFAEAANSKRRELRILAANPALGVRPPERGCAKAKVYPYPSEFLKVASCADIPLPWRELHALAAYSYARPGELQVLEWSDVDLDDRKIRITRAWDYKNDRVKSTKTGEARTIPIEPNLLPLLACMRKRARGKGLVVPVLGEANDNKLAIIMRGHFARAGCDRPRLTMRSAAELRLRFRSWRDAGITWAIVRGDDLVKVQRRAGHRLIATTMRYIVEAENAGAAFGVPFPPLPACLLGAEENPAACGGIVEAAGDGADLR
jgi:integrase